MFSLTSVLSEICRHEGQRMKRNVYWVVNIVNGVMIWRPRVARLSNYRRVIRLLCQEKKPRCLAVQLLRWRVKYHLKCFAQETCCHLEKLSSYLFSWAQTCKVILVDKICLLQLKRVVKSLWEVSLWCPHLSHCSLGFNSSLCVIACHAVKYG